MNIIEELSRIKKIKYVEIDENLGGADEGTLDFKILGEQISMRLKNQKLIEKEAKTNFKNAQNIEKLYDNLDNMRSMMNSLSENVKSTMHSMDENEKMARLFMYLYDYIDDKEIALLNTTETKDKTNEYILEQLEAILKKAKDIMKKADINVEDPQLKKFDTDLHEIVGTEKNDNYDDETIVRVLKKGFIFKGKVLRKAKVVTILNKE